MTKFSLLVSVLLFTITVSGQSLPDDFQGNWLSHDGRNEPVLCLYPQALVLQGFCYNLDSVAAEKQETTVWFSTPGTAQRAKEKIRLTLLPDHTLQLQQADVILTLDKKRTFRANAPPVNEPFTTRLTVPAPTVLNGLFSTTRRQDPSEDPPILTLSYVNIFTGEFEYVHCRLGANGLFSFQLPLQQVQEAVLNIRENVYNVMLQPGAMQTVIIHETGIKNNRVVDYDADLQQICFAGAGASFANARQHYIRYMGSKGYPEFKLPSAVLHGNADTVRKQAGKQYYKSLYEDLLLMIGKLYPEKEYGSSFTAFLQQDLKYTIASAVIKSLRNDFRSGYYALTPDSTDQAFIYDLFFKEADENEFNCVKFHAAVNDFSRLVFERYDRTIAYKTGTIANRIARVQQDYSALLPPPFIEKFTEITRDLPRSRELRDKELIEKYFAGDEQKAYEFMYLYVLIDDQFAQEGADSAFYEIYRKEIPSRFIRSVADLIRLQNNWKETGLTSITPYRLRIFQQYADTSLPFIRTALSLLGKNKEEPDLAGLKFKSDPEKFRHIKTEEDWQTELKRFRGKTVVLAIFPHSFEKARVSLKLFFLQQLKEKYKENPDVLFLICLEKRERRDWLENQMAYLEMFQQSAELGPVYSLEKNISVYAAIQEACIADFICIYNNEGLVHNPAYFLMQSWEEKKNQYPKPAAELEKVLDGKAICFEKQAGYFLFKDNRFSREYGDRISLTDRFGNNIWTQVRQSGNYFTFLYGTPREPNREYNNGDTLFHRVGFSADSNYYEYDVILHKAGNTTGSPYYEGRTLYREEYIVKNKTPLYYNWNQNQDRVISIRNEKGVVLKKWKVVFINKALMVLELIP